MLTEKIVEGDVLYHSIHGMCRVERIVKQNQSGQDTLSYSLVPKLFTRMKIRFMIPAEEIEKSGFHVPVSVDEADEILEYLKKGKVTADVRPQDIGRPSFAEENGTWALARSILSFVQGSDSRDSRKRQNIARTVKGLVRELAYVWDISVKDSAAKIQKNLEKTSKLPPVMLDAFADAADA